MSVAIYLRVSTGKQDELGQLPACERLCAARGWDAPAVVREVASGVKQRPEWERLQELARVGVVRIVVVWSLDRLGRRMFELINDLQALARWGCAVVSVSEAWLDGTGPYRDLMLSQMAWVAQWQHQRIIEGTHRGLERARKRGRYGGRPRKMPIGVVERARELREDGSTWPVIVAQLEAEGLGEWMPQSVASGVARYRP